MASALNTPPQINCKLCDAIQEEEIFKQCSNGHIVCSNCYPDVDSECKCSSSDSNLDVMQTTNPIKVTGIECSYKKDGCPLILSESIAMKEHIKECSYRPYVCLGSDLGLWKCDWYGLQKDFVSHVKECHPENGEYSGQHQKGFVEYDSARRCNKFKIIDALNEKFVFLFVCIEDSELTHFIIYLLGRRSDAREYIYNFEIENGKRKMMFTENCYSDTDLNKFITDHYGIILPKDMVERFASLGNLEFQLTIKRNEDIEESEMKTETEGQIEVNENESTESGFANEIILNIMEHLDDAALSTMARVNKRFKEIAKKVFGKRYNGQDAEHCFQLNIEAQNTIADQKKYRPLLCTFGENLGGLEVNFDTNLYARNNWTHRLIKQRCKSLKRITIRYGNQLDVTELNFTTQAKLMSVPFEREKIDRTVIRCSWDGADIIKTIAPFEDIIKLQIDSTNLGMDHFRQIVQSLPLLKRVEFSNVKAGSQIYENLFEFILIGNSKLNSLSISLWQIEPFELSQGEIFELSNITQNFPGYQVIISAIVKSECIYYCSDHGIVRCNSKTIYP